MLKNDRFVRHVKSEKAGVVLERVKVASVYEDGPDELLA